MNPLLNADCYDPNEELPSPSIEALNEMLNSANTWLFSKVPTPAGMNPSNHSSLSSPPQSTTLLDIFPFEDLGYNSDVNGYQLNSSLGSLGTTLPTNDHLEIILSNNYPLSNASSTEYEDEKLSILVQPKTLFRARYSSEINPTKHRAQRYIRAEEGTPKYDHPTIKIPSKWLDPTRQLYIRVTLVTVKTKKIHHHYIHPYKIDTLENNVLKDKKNNSLYFPINPNEILTGEKSFLISLTKMIQSELKSYGPFRLFDSNEFNDQHIQNLHDAKQIIALYELSKCQLVFTIAELQNNNSLLVPFSYTSIESRIMTDETVIFQNQSNEISINQIKCIPQKGNWEGNEEIVLIMPNSIKKKEYSIYFDLGEHQILSITEIQYIDTKTILFRTPSCPLLPGNEDFKISIIIQENQMNLPKIDFYYVTPLKTIINLCSNCQGSAMKNSSNNKRRYQHDNAESLISQMNELSIEQKSQQSHSEKPLNGENSKFDKYLNQLKDALELFVRENDPSKLFRRTRILLSKYNDSSPLYDAIKNGHINIALSLIEQIIDMPIPNQLLDKENTNGETCLLISAKTNQWKIIELILKSRFDLIKQKDTNNNNIFHLLTNLNNDKSMKIIENILKNFSDKNLQFLLKEKNKQNQTPIDIAKLNENNQILQLLTSFLDTEKN